MFLIGLINETKQERERERERSNSSNSKKIVIENSKKKETHRIPTQLRWGKKMKQIPRNIPIETPTIKSRRPMDINNHHVILYSSEKIIKNNQYYVI